MVDPNQGMQMSDSHPSKRVPDGSGASLLKCLLNKASKTQKRTELSLFPNKINRDLVRHSPYFGGDCLLGGQADRLGHYNTASHPDLCALSSPSLVLASLETKSLSYIKCLLSVGSPNLPLPPPLSNTASPPAPSLLISLRLPLWCLAAWRGLRLCSLQPNLS